MTVIAAIYAANAGAAPSALLARGDMPHRVAIIKCSGILRLPQTRVAASERVVRNDAGHLELRLRGLERSFSVSRSFAHRFESL